MTNWTNTTITVKVTVPEGLYIPNQHEEHDPTDPLSVSAELAHLIEELLTGIGVKITQLSASDVYKITRYQ